MKRLLIVCEYPTLNGGERSMLATLEGVAASGFEIHVAAPGEGALARAILGQGIETLPFPPDGTGSARLPQQELRQRLAELLRRVRPALLHANSLAMGRLSGPVAAELGVPSIAHLRDIVRLSKQAAADLNRHTRLLAVSEATRQFHVAGGLAAEKIYVLFNGVDLDQFRPRPPSGFLHRELGIPAAAPLVGTIGQIGLRKGQDVLVEAAIRVARTRPDVHYVLVGERSSDKAESREFERSLREAARALSGRCHFLGVRQDVDRMMNEWTLLVHPARQEPLGRVLLEAAASGLPLVATDVGGTREIFPPDSQSARLIPPDDPTALAVAILGLLDDLPTARMLGQRSRRRAEAVFDVHRTTPRLVEHYRQVAGL